MGRIVLGALVSLFLPVCAFATVEGNPDQRASIELGAGYGMGTLRFYETEFDRDDRVLFEDEQGLTRFGARFTLPTSRSLSFLVSVRRETQGEPRSSVGVYTRYFVTMADVGVRIFLP